MKASDRLQDKFQEPIVVFRKRAKPRFHLKKSFSKVRIEVICISRSIDLPTAALLLKTFSKFAEETENGPARCHVQRKIN